MKFWSKFTAFQLILVFLLGPSVEVMAQTYSGTGNTNNSQQEVMDAQRAKSSSFGSSEKDQQSGVKPPTQPTMQTMQDMGFRGLTYQVHVLDRKSVV